MSCAGQAVLSETAAAMTTTRELESIVRTHARLVFQVAYSVLRNREDAEDASQETYIRLMRQDLEKIDEPRLWLARVAWRVSVDRVRQRPAHPFDDVADHSERLASADVAAEEALLERELRNRLETFIDALPRDLRQVVRLSTVEEMTSADVAHVLGIPEGTVRTRMSRARQVLREKLMHCLEKK